MLISLTAIGIMFNCLLVNVVDILLLGLGLQALWNRLAKTSTQNT